MNTEISKEKPSIAQEVEKGQIDWGSPVILIFKNGFSIVTYIAMFEERNTVLLKDPYTVSRNYEGGMILLKFLPETANEFHTIGMDNILTIGAVAPEVLETYANVVFGKKPNETIH